MNYSNAAGREALSAWSAEGSSPSRALKPLRKLPAQIQSACHALRKGWEQAVLADDMGKAERNVSLLCPSDSRFRAELRVVEAKAGRALQPSFAIHFHLPPTENAEAARALSRLSRLTPPNMKSHD